MIKAPLREHIEKLIELDKELEELHGEFKEYLCRWNKMNEVTEEQSKYLGRILYDLKNYEKIIIKKARQEGKIEGIAEEKKRSIKLVNIDDEFNEVRQDERLKNIKALRDENRFEASQVLMTDEELAKELKSKWVY